MKLTARPTPITLCLIAGAAIGALGGSAIVLLPWAIIGLAIGVLAESRGAAIYNGTVYGFAVAYSFMLTSYNGKDPITTKLLPFVIFGIIGAICGLALALIAYYAKQLLKRR